MSEQFAVEMQGIVKTFPGIVACDNVPPSYSKTAVQTAVLFVHCVYLSILIVHCVRTVSVIERQVNYRLSAGKMKKSRANASATWQSSAISATTSTMPTTKAAWPGTTRQLALCGRKWWANTKAQPPGKAIPWKTVRS